MLSLSFIILTCLIALLAVNRRLTLSTRGVRSLSSRYQITENVRALRLLVPVVVLDTSITATDMIGSQIFGVLPIFETRKCLTIKAYMVAYIVLRLAAVVLQYGIPVFIIRHESIRKVIPVSWLRKKVNSKGSGPLEVNIMVEKVFFEKLSTCQCGNGGRDFVAAAVV
ncbi:hypothetical protein OESDEN_17872 [Oesophagostomum dentatum]|uniref:G-protein coupled receptors family 1 profile domain-containing protein n=1 Tax=Oesophagostomum dentatum TaxID=61180 RepID=A0A0B1SBY2_OESDE|nr:hypothetical protein OESDEN_17872 [Oesophagostomum dentatum]